MAYYDSFPVLFVKLSLFSLVSSPPSGAVVAVP